MPEEEGTKTLVTNVEKIEEKKTEPKPELKQEGKKELYLIVMTNGAVRSQEQLMLDYDLNFKQGVFTHVFNLVTRQQYAGNNQWTDIPHVVYTIPDTPPVTNEKGKEEPPVGDKK